LGSSYRDEYSALPLGVGCEASMSRSSSSASVDGGSSFEAGGVVEAAAVLVSVAEDDAGAAIGMVT
jgi:hypothetical protein